MKKIIAIQILFLLSITALAQINQPWRGKKCAVVLTYDDAIDQHLDHAIPVLDSLGLKATFYITGFSNSMQTRLNDWKKIGASEHELGNHTLFHPCIGNRPGRDWVTPENDMNRYTVERMKNEVRMTNLFLQALDGKTKRTFAFTCGDMKIGEVSFINDMKKDFTAARAVRNQMHKINEVDLYNLDCYMVNGETGAQMIEWVKKSMETNSLLVILFHGVGGGNALNVSVSAHRELLQYLKQNEKDIMIAPMLETAEHIKDWQNLNGIRNETEEDYKDMLVKLNIVSIRPGANGNGPNTAIAANYDETKANPFPTLPDPLALKNGEKAKDAKTCWNKRRPEIVEDLDREIYGRMPANTPKVNWELVSTVDTMISEWAIKLKRLIDYVDNSSFPFVSVDIQLTLATPGNSSAPLPRKAEWKPPTLMAARGYLKFYMDHVQQAHPGTDLDVLQGGSGAEVTRYLH